MFCASMSDWLDDRDVVIDAGKPTERIDRGGIETLADLLDLIRRTPNLDWLLLTKRPENFDRLLLAAQLYLIDQCKRAAPFSRRSDMAATAAWLAYWRPGSQVPPNVWFGVSAEDQKRWDERIPILLSIPAAVRFVSVEPMLGPIKMWRTHNGQHEPCDNQCGPCSCGAYHQGPAWVIFGGESGRNRRPFEIDWLADGIRQCDEAGVKVFTKQDAALKSGQQGRIPDELWQRKEWPK